VGTARGGAAFLILISTQIPCQTYAGGFRLLLKNIKTTLAAKKRAFSAILPEKFVNLYEISKNKDTIYTSHA
jgi:hypothetical protein